MQKLIIPLLLSSSIAMAQECVMQEKIVNKSDVVIKELSEIRRDVVPWSKNEQKCIVNFKALIGDTWYAANGEYIWDGELPSAEACGAAVNKAKKDLTAKVKPATLLSEEVLICNDDRQRSNIKVAKVGSIVDISQLRAHPNYTNKFYHNGTECRWFLDSSWTGKDIRQYQGVACKLEPSKWVVVDKF